MIFESGMSNRYCLGYNGATLKRKTNQSFINKLRFFDNNRVMAVISITLLLVMLKISDSAKRVGYDHIPETFTILDERTNVWHGLSIRETGVPAAWSDLRSYWDYQNSHHNTGGPNFDWKGFNLYVDGKKPTVIPRNFQELVIITRQFDFGNGNQLISVVQPYLDHPPFGALVLSSLVPTSIHEAQDLNAFDFRKTSLWLADLTLILIFVVGWLLFKNPVIGLLSAAVYGTAPTFLLTSRLALLENVMIPMELLTLAVLLIACNYAKKKWKLPLLVLSGILAGLTFLSKTPGTAMIISGAIILFLNKEQRRTILFFLIPAVLVSSFYFVWGLFWAPDLFPALLVEGSSKRLFVGSLSFILEVFKFGAQNFPVDGWWIGSFLSLLWLKKSPETMPIIVSIISFLFVILFTGASSFAWYFLPLVPFLCLSTGLFLYKLATDPRISEIILFFLIFFSSTWFWAYGVLGANPNFINHQQQYLFYKILLLIFFGGAILSQVYHGKSLRFRMIWMVGVFLVLAFCFAWNIKSFFYILEHWGKLGNNLSPNWTF